MTSLPNTHANWTNVSTTLAAPKFDPFGGHDLSVVIMISIACIVWSLLTAGGNGLVIIAFFINKNLQITTNYYILSLAVADFLIGLFTINFYCMYVIMNYWPLGELACNLWLLMDYGGCQASVISLVLVCNDRYHAVSNMVHSRKHNIGKAKLAIVISWILSFLMWFLMIFLYPPLTGKKLQNGECIALFLQSSVVATSLSHMLGYFVPVILISIQYTRLYLLLQERQRAINQSTTVYKDKILKVRPSVVGLQSGVNLEAFAKIDETEDTINEDEKISTENFPEPCQSKVKVQSHQKIRSIQVTPHDTTADLNTFNKSSLFAKSIIVQKRVLHMIFLVIATYFVCWFSYEIFAMIKPFCSSCISDSLWNFSYGFCYVNSTLNPACYTGANREFRETFKRILCCRGANNGNDSGRSRKLQKSEPSEPDLGTSVGPVFSETKVINFGTLQ